MDRTQQIKDAHPWLSYEEVVKILIYHHQGSSWIQNLKSDKLQRSMEAFTKLLKSKSRKALEPFVNYVQNVYYNGIDEYGNQIEESSREESFEHRWNKARAILLKST
jgi:predicted RNA-binding protein with PUA domain